ncbi:MAG: hypothetical protein ABIY35_01880 [Chitinophagaceae bacterium]
MKILRIVAFLFIYFTITFLWLLYDRRKLFGSPQLFGSPIIEVLQLPAIWIFPILMIVAGLLFTIPYSYFRKTKTRTFILGQLTCLGITTLLFLYTFISDLQHEKQFGNFENNRANRDNTFFLADTIYQIKAYDALEKNFSDKNSFRITDLFSDTKDTVINSLSTKVHISWFEYYLSEDPKKFLCAKYLVFNDTIMTEYINSDATKQLDFKNRKMYKDSLLKFVDSVIN